MGKKAVLAFDLGTTGNKAVLIEAERGILTTTFVPYGTSFPRPGWAEQDPLEWWRSVCACTQQLLKSEGIRAEEIAAVSFSGQMMGCVPVDKQGAPLRMAIIWADQRAQGEADQLLAGLSEKELYNITGHRVGPAYSAPKMMWIARHEPKVYDKTWKFLQAKDFIVHKLTDRFCTDPSDACGTGLLDLRRLDWSERILAVTSLAREKLPEVCPSTAVVGEVTSVAARATGLRKGTPVVLGAGDGVCATVGAGVVDEGRAYLYLGSSAWIGAASREPRLDPLMGTVTWPHVVNNWYSPNGTMHNAGSCMEWAKAVLGADDVRAFEELARKSSPGSGGVLFLPYLMGERAPYWNANARAAWVGLSRTHGPEHCARAVYEGVAFHLRTILEALERRGLFLPALRVAGGGAQSQLWTQILADVLQRPLEILRDPVDVTALGAGILGLVGVGIVPTVEQAAKALVPVVSVVTPHDGEAYEALFRAFGALYAQLVPCFEALANWQTQHGGD